MVKRSFYRKKMRQKSRFAGTEEQPKPKLVGFYTDKEIDKVRPITKTSGKRVKKQIQVKQPRERRPASFKQPKKSKFELKEMSDIEVQKTQKGMDHRVAGWEYGNYRFFLLSSVGYYAWWRIETKDGEHVKSGEMSNTANVNKVLYDLGDEVEKLTGNKVVADEFRKPYREAVKNKEIARKILEANKGNKLIQAFQKRFSYGHEPSEDDVVRGMLVSNDKAVGLVLDKKSEAVKGFEGVQGVSAKINPVTRSKFKDYDKDILMGNEVYKAYKIYDSLMVLNTKEPLTIRQAKEGLLMIEDSDGEQIIIAPLEKEGIEADRLVRVIPISNYIGGKPYAKKDAVAFLERQLEANRQAIIEEGKKLWEESELKGWVHTQEERVNYVNSELGHGRVTENYLGIKEKIMQLKGQTVNHDELWKPYHENRGIWKDGEILI